MAAAAEKTADELRREIQELQRQHREITERLRDPRGLRRSTAATPGGPRPLRGVLRPAMESEDQSAPKRRLLSAVVKVDGKDAKEDAEKDGVKNAEETVPEEAAGDPDGSARRVVNSQSNGVSRRDGGQRMMRKMDYDMPPPEPLPRVFPKDEDPRLVKRNRRMLGQLIGTLEKFRQEDKKLSSTEAYMRRSDSLRRAEEKAREESERLRQHEREEIAEKRRRDMTLRARVAAKAEEKRLELLYIQWAEHHKKLSNYLRTKAEPPIYYMPTKPLVDDAAVIEHNKEKAFEEWKSVRRAELSEFQKQVEKQYLANVEKQLERWQNAQNARKASGAADMQEMDKELETHRLEHGPKTRRIPGGSNEDDEDVEDMAVEDELMDEVLGVNQRINEDPTKLSEEPGDGTKVPGETQ